MLSQHESFSFDSTSSTSEFPKKLDLPPSSLPFSSNNKFNFNHEDLSINDSISEKSINRTNSFRITKTLSSFSSNLESETFDLKSKSLLVNESSSCNKDHEANYSQKNKKKETSETHD